MRDTFLHFTGFARRFAPHLRGSPPSTWLPDGVAGLTVAALALPQGLAYAMVAGVPVEMGVLAAALPCAVAALLGSSPHLVTGPTAPVALIVGSAVVAPLVASGAGDVTAYVAMAGLLAAAMLIAFSLAGLGSASRFMSDSVVMGFATGVGVLIALRVLADLSPDVVEAAARHPFEPRAWQIAVAAVRGVLDAEPRSLAMAVLVPITIIGLRKVDARIPAALIVLVAATALVRLMGWNEGDNPIAAVGPIPVRYPTFHTPDMVRPTDVAAAAFAVAVLVTLQSVAAARSVHPIHAERLDPDREIFAQGAANLAAAVIGALPTSGSLSRSAVARSAGGRTRLAALVSGLAILGLLPVAASWVEQIPIPALVGLVALSGAELVNSRSIRRATTTPGDGLVFLATLAATLVIDVVQALYAGLFLSLLLLVRRSGHLRIVELVRSGDRYREIEIDERTGDAPAVFLHLEGDLNFAVAPELAERLDEIASRDAEVLVLRMKRAPYIDATVLETLRQTAVKRRRAGGRLVLCGLAPELAERLAESELLRWVDREDLVPTGDRLFDGFESALTRVGELLPSTPVDDLWRSEVGDSGDRAEVVHEVEPF